MDKEIEAQLNAQIAEFKNTAWNSAIEELNSYLEYTGIKLFDFYSPYSVSMELLINNEPFFKVTFFFRMYHPNDKYAYWHVKPSVSLHKGNMEMSGLEKRYTAVDKEISQITGADISYMVKSLIRQYGGK